MVDYLPPMPMKRERAVKLAKQFAFIGYQVIKMRPSLIPWIAQAEIKVEAEYYATLAVMSAVFQGTMLFAALAAMVWLLRRPDLLLLVLGLSAFVALFMFVRILAYPAYIVQKRVKEIEKNFLYALRHMSIQVSGGAPVFNSVVSIADAGYGNVSEEFGRVVREVNTGESMGNALENMALRNPSIYFRRAVWQIVNSLRTGSDMGYTLRMIVDQFAAEQRVLLEKFGKELGPWAMMYMMITVIFPTLGITLFLIVSSLSTIKINEFSLGAFVVASAVVQYFFLQFLRSKRPSIRW
jgi:flagellar protein FlaJ